MVQLHLQIYTLMKNRDGLGVTEIARALNVPVATVHKYLRRQQSFFWQGEDSKWYLPLVDEYAWPGGEPSAEIKSWITDPITNLGEIRKGIITLRKALDLHKKRLAFLEALDATAGSFKEVVVEKKVERSTLDIWYERLLAANVKAGNVWDLKPEDKEYFTIEEIKAHPLLRKEEK